MMTHFSGDGEVTLVSRRRRRVVQPQHRDEPAHPRQGHDARVNGWLCGGVTLYTTCACLIGKIWPTLGFIFSL